MLGVWCGVSGDSGDGWEWELICRWSAFDPEQSFVREPRSGHSVAVGKDIQGARRAARRHFQHVRVDHGRRYVRMPQQLLHSSDTLAQLVQNPGGQQHKGAGFDGIL